MPLKTPKTENDTCIGTPSIYPEIFVWVEHRTKKGNGNAAYICSASYSLSYGGGGLLRKTVPPD